ncbi:MAG: SBBP repeat-containing protein [Rhodospirillales bacterium]
MASSRRTACGAVIAAVSIALDIAAVGAEDRLPGEQPGAIAISAAPIEHTSGRRLWSRQPGTSGSDGAGGVATDPDGNVYAVGSTEGASATPNKGNGDAWVIKFDRSGRRLWSRQPGTSDADRATGVATDHDSNVYVVGETYGPLGGPNKGYTDAWVIKFDRSGRQLWSRQVGTRDYDDTRGVATDQDGNVYVVGETHHALGGAYKGVLRCMGDQVRPKRPAAVEPAARNGRR